MKYYQLVLKNYAVFTGRATRSEYWYFVLFNIIFLIVARAIDHMLGTNWDYDRYYSQMYEHSYVSIHTGLIGSLYSLAVLVPGLAVIVRRLHDVGKSGWFFLIVFIPFIGIIWLLVLFCTDSVVGENKYGPNPQGIGNEIDELGSHLVK
jgi:uncharacterized membrane protein YhaH (DUF805 family)